LYSPIGSRRFLVSDLRDKIHPLLGIVGELVAGKERCKPVHGERSPADTYIMVAVQILMDTDDLLSLAMLKVTTSEPYLTCCHGYLIGAPHALLA
jgi:hypothetical protein